MRLAKRERALADAKRAVYDQKTHLLYVSIHQLFTFWFVPFYHARVKLVTVLQLVQSEESKYYIKSQEDMYQSTELIKFLLPGGSVLVRFWQWIATAMCIAGALLLAPMTWLEQRHHKKIQ